MSVYYYKYEFDIISKNLPLRKIDYVSRIMNKIIKRCHDFNEINYVVFVSIDVYYMYSDLFYNYGYIEKDDVLYRGYHLYFSDELELNDVLIGDKQDCINYAKNIKRIKKLNKINLKN